MNNQTNYRTPLALSVLESVLSSAEKLALGLAGLFVFVMLLVTGADVVGRYLFNNALGWAYDSVLVLMVGLCFLSASSLQARQGHISMEVLYQRMPLGARHVLSCFHFAIGACVFGLIGWKNLEYAIEAGREGWIYGGFGVIPTWLPYSFIAVGSLLMTTRLLLQCLTLILQGRHSPLLPVVPQSEGTPS